MSDLLIRQPNDHDLATAIRLLGDAGLPVEDLTLERLALAADVGDNLAGVVGLERFDRIGLLRSLVVTPDGRGQGIGRALVAALEDTAVRDGITELWLLTIDADPYFEALGYARRERDDAPPTIRATEEFSNLCPGDAVVMSKSLD